MIENGLTTHQVSKLKQKHGDNLIPQKEKSNWFTILFSQFKSPLIYLLIAVGIISFIFNEKLDALLINLVIFFNVAMGFFQEYSAQKTLSALKKIVRSKSYVIRDGKRIEIESKDLVPGDIVIISSGDKIPADGKVIKGTGLLVNEAILTGEEEAVTKIFGTEKGVVFMGTTLISGQGIMQIEKTGKETRIGKIGLSLSEIEDEDTPLQKRLKEFIKNIIYLVVFISGIFFIIGAVNNKDLLETLRLSVVLSVSAIPEGLPVAITVILALGMRRILKRKGLVKKLISIETLGSTSTICIDKTGTLTEGKMQVVQTSFVDKEKALLALTLLNDRKVAIEVAIWNYLEKESRKNPDLVFNSYERISEEPFDSSNKYKSVINKNNTNEVLYMMGAPDILIKFCNLSQKERLEAENQIESWAKKGLRIIGITYKIDGNLKQRKGLTWLGILGIEDPVRPEAKETLVAARNAGIDVKIVTGDYRLTAVHLAKKIGLSLDSESIMDFEQLKAIDEEELSEKIDKIKLFSRVTPLQKLKIIEALQAKGEVVAMTGDGVNDAPALKKADIGIVVENGTDVAKEASDLVLLDNNFKTIMAACEEGRLILMNIKKVVGYVLSNSFGEIVLITGSIFLNLPTPLTIAQILWINLICDGPPDIMLGFEPKEKRIMKLSPNDIKEEQILSPAMKFLVFTLSLIVGGSGLLVFKYYHESLNDLTLARTLTFSILAASSLVYIFAFKNLNKLIIHTENFFQNKLLILSVIYGFFLIFLAVYVPALNKILSTTPLSISHWVVVFGVAAILLIFIESTKVIVTKVFRKNSI